MFKTLIALLKTNFFSFRSVRPFFLFVFGLFAFFFVILDFLFFRRVFYNLFAIKEVPEQALLIVSSKLISLVFLTTYTMLIFSSAISLLSSLYLDEDLDFLYSLPVRRWSIITKGIVDAFFTSSIMVVLLLFPIMLSFYSVKCAGIKLPILSFLTFILFIIPPLSVGGVVTILLARFFPAKRLYQFLTILGVVMLSLLVVFIRMAKPENLLNPREASKVEKIISSINLPSEASLPSTWLSRAVVTAGVGDGERFFYYSLKLFFLCLSSLLILFVLTKLFYNKGFLFSKERIGAIVFKGRSKFEKILYILLKKAPIPNQLKGLFYKETLVFFRNATEWGQVFILLALVVVYIYNINYLPKDIESMKVIVALLNYATLSFIVASVAARFTFTSLGSEGKAFYTLKTLPLKPSIITLNKFLFTSIPTTGFSIIIFFASSLILELKGVSFYYFLFATFVTSFVLSSLALFMGSLNPQFNEKNPTKMVVSVEGFEFMFFSMIFVALGIVLSAKPIYLTYFVNLITREDPLKYFTLSFSLFTLALFIVPLLFYLSARKLINYEVK